MTVAAWVYAEREECIISYLMYMEKAGWGGEVELLAFAQLFGVNVVVYIRSADPAFPSEEYSRFNAAGGGGLPIVSVLYIDGNHYDALEMKQPQQALSLSSTNAVTPVPCCASGAYNTASLDTPISIYNIMMMMYYD